MDTNFNRNEKLVGTFLITIALVLLVILLIIGRGKDWFKVYITYYTIFDESYNIQEDSAVKLYNTEVGKVKKITLFKDKVKVELTVLEDYASRIKTDSVAVVESPAFFMGTEYVSIKPGGPDAGIIPEGGEIPSIAKKSITDFMTELGLQEIAKKVVIAAEDLVEIVKKLKDPQGPLFATLDNAYKTTFHVEGLTRDMQAGKGTVGKLLKSSELLDAIQSQLKKVDKILENVAEASTRAPKTIDRVTDSLDSVKSILDEVLESVSRIKRILGEAEKGSREIPKISQSARRGLEEARTALEDADKIMQSLQKNILIRSNLPPEPKGETVDAGLR
jgi:phospholipid/cholesterol/gamma-HCH transport system substrate-binding protein